MRFARTGLSGSGELLKGSETMMGDRPPRVRRNRPPTDPKTNPDGRKSELFGDLPEPSGVVDDGEVSSHDGDTVQDAPREVKCDLHREPRYPGRMDVANRLKIARERAGYTTAKAASEAMGVSQDTYRQHENGIRGFAAATAKRYAKFFKVSVSWLLYGEGEEPEQKQIANATLTPINRYVPVLGNVQAGAWSMIPVTQPEPEEYVPVHLPGFEHAQLFALRVIGDSMNMVYKPDARVIVCPTAEIGIRENDHVVVRRHRHGEVETTIKEIVRDAQGLALWPRSTNPAFQEPIRLKERPDADDGIEIIGVVVAEFHVRPLQPKPLIRF